MTEIKPTDAFVDQIMRAIVNQFFENPQIITDGTNGYIPQRSTPSQVVASRLLGEKQGELIDKIMERIDLDVFANQVAEKAIAILLAPNSTGWMRRDVNDVRRDEIKKRVDSRLVELLAADMFATMQDEKNKS